MLRVIPFCVYLLLVLPLLVLPLPLQAASGHPPPNVLLLLADDLGYNDSGIYQDVYQQKPVASMPTLEAFAREGMRFSRFYTESTCSASRVALLTGQYPARQGFIPVARGISPDVLTLPEYFQSRGYVTHHVGKWHAGEINREAFPEEQGFDSSFGFLSQWMLRGPDAEGEVQLKSPTYHNPWLRDGQKSYRQYEGHLEDILTARTVNIIREAGQQPWFIYHAFLAPHTPLEPAADFAKNFPATQEGKYLALLAQLDHNLSKIFAELQSRGQWDNTIIVFASDNGSQNKGSQNKGSQAGHANSNAPFAGGKASYDEGGIRAPLVIKWHKRLSGGKSLRTDPVSIMDIYASLRAVLDHAFPATVLDGRSSLLPGAEAQKIPSLKAFYSFDSLSLFDSVGQQRLIREWSGEKFIRSEWLNYDDRGLPVVRPHSLWERWFVSGENEGEAKIFQQFLDWRDEVRRVPVQVKPLADAAYEISGSDFLRTPVNPSYALAFALTPTSQNQAPLLVQEGIMEVMLKQGTLSARVHHMEVRMEGLKAGQCYSVVLSGAFYDRYSNVRDTILPSRLSLVVDGVLRDTAVSTIESLARLPLATPHIAKGIMPPHFFTTQLLPAERPFSSGLDRELSGLCTP